MNIVFRSSNSIRNAFRFKDQIPKYIHLKVVYKYKCKERHFLALEYEHLRKTMLNKKNLKHTRKDASAIGKHFQCFSLAGNAGATPYFKIETIVQPS